MALHLLKMAVGVESIDHLARLQGARLARAGVLRHMTRHRPRRADEILDSGSIYWVIRGFIRVRQRILGLDRSVDDEGRGRCAILLDAALVPTAMRAQRPLQGWRYLAAADAPPDAAMVAAGETVGEALPSEMAAELYRLGLL
jgi:hypothetical protein